MPPLTAIRQRLQYLGSELKKLWVIGATESDRFNKLQEEADELKEKLEKAEEVLNEDEQEDNT